jgi:SAM-dependent methyltransferase
MATCYTTFGSCGDYTGVFDAMEWRRNRSERRPDVTLWAEFLNHHGRIVDKWKHYFPAYETHLARYVNRPLTFLEIGVGEGGSLQMWKRYFGPHAQLVGIDIAPRCTAFEEDQIAIRIGDQSDKQFLADVLEEFGAPDVVIDDGSHIVQHVVATFGELYHRTAPDGVYIVEDLHTTYWEEYGGGMRHPGTFVELCKTLLDELNADFTRGALPPTAFTRSTLSMHFYDSMAVFERGRTTRKMGLRIGQQEG